ncbi:Uncharacterized protein MCHI_003760 [Candidatus Magnetoovum chiemensis]|nr:Uncharacterized protein MCHI_003760 [Candidatus Magnetoovum chiemensis]
MNKDKTSSDIKTIRVKFSHGLIEPLEEIEITEGREFIITIHNDVPTKPKKKLKGLYKGLKIEDEDIKQARKSLFSNE